MGGWARRPLRRLNRFQPIREARLAGRLGFLFPLYQLLIRWSTRHPVGFREKLEYKMARDRRPLLRTFADKLETRGYVERVVGDGYLIPLLAVADRAGDLPWDDLPSEVALKVSHGSGGGVVMRGNADPATRVPEASLAEAWTDTVAVRPESASRASIVALLDMHLGLDYYWVLGEWAYHRIERKAFAEEIVRGPGGGYPLEFRCYTFGGRCEVIIAGTALVSPMPPMDVFLPDWTPVDATRPGTRHHDSPPERPACLREMIEVAEALGKETDFVRVDFLSDGDRLRVGELTSYPYGGRVPLEPPERERWLGDFWTVPRRYSTLPQGSYPLRRDS